MNDYNEHAAYERAKAAHEDAVAERDLAAAIERLTDEVKFCVDRQFVWAPVLVCDLRTVLDAIKELRMKEKKPC